MLLGMTSQLHSTHMLCNKNWGGAWEWELYLPNLSADGTVMAKLAIELSATRLALSGLCRVISVKGIPQAYL